MKILLIGGAGYVGSACLRWLLHRGHDPIALDNLSEGNAAAVPEGRLIIGDIEDREFLRRVLAERNIEAVMHFAAAASVPESLTDPELYYRTNVLGTKNVLDAMVSCGVTRLIFSSTAATYAFHNDMPLTEDSLQAPQVPYGVTKLAAEWMIADYARAYGLGAVLLRYFNASGADPGGEHGEDRRHESHLIPLVLKTALGLQDKLLVFGDDWNTRDGTCVRDYVHTADLAQAHELALLAIEPANVRCYNLGAGRGTTVREVIAACESAAGRSIPVEIADRRPGDPAVLIASPEKIQRELDWTPRYSDITDIVSTAWLWHCTHPDGYTEHASDLPEQAAR